MLGSDFSASALPILQEEKGAPLETLSVSSLIQCLQTLLEEAFPYPFNVQGELIDVMRASSGHVYFSLKDSDAQIRCVMFRGRSERLVFNPENGLSVLLRGRANIYKSRGGLQLVVETMQVAGQGDLFVQFERLKKKLSVEGLFDPRHKKEIPSIPKKIGVITSYHGAAGRDVLKVLARRMPLLEVLMFHAQVQGEWAPSSIISALNKANMELNLDAILLVRGGGSFEDLNAFNDEELARYIYAYPIPIVSGIGHETDFTLAEFVSDLRAPTPSAAAESVSVSVAHLSNVVETLRKNMHAMMKRQFAALASLLNNLLLRLHQGHPRNKVHEKLQLLDELGFGLYQNISKKIQASHIELAEQEKALMLRSPAILITGLQSQLDAYHQALVVQMRNLLGKFYDVLKEKEAVLGILSPTASLKRGYAIVTTEDRKVIFSAGQVRLGHKLHITLNDGEIIAKAVSKDQNQQGGLSHREYHAEEVEEADDIDGVNASDA